MKRLAVLTATAVLGGVLAIPAFGATKSVTVGDNYFVRKTSGVPSVSVRRGDTVVWRWRGRNPHNVIVTRGPVKFRSSVKTTGTYRKRMRRRGTYTIVCTIHGGMDMRLRVR
jgi:ribosomal protein L36